ncbi:NYN domain-containing protein [Streptomonospora litoralis]|uniref:NYN domain protein n=1 Tax=Streptomonospora litoralis TaxID=2498135 RepID=A0A4P6Q6W7_9ACTN|nr:NYN domain-containing protein [Streptomonospora litoralis]QBI56526.1 NYN domain protein [Streptomonospora litoralis]
MDRCALFVDAGYLLADGAMAVHGTRNRDSVSWDYAGLVQLLNEVARDRTRLPLLRCYWYEATSDGRRTQEQDGIADIPGIKFRAARIRPGRREGVESYVQRDLTTLARTGVLCEAVLVSGDEDMAQVVSDVQDLGVRVTVVHISVEGNWTISRALRRECDDLIEIGAGHLRPHVTLLSGVGDEDAVETTTPLSNGRSHSAPEMPRRPVAANPAPGRVEPAAAPSGGYEPVFANTGGQSAMSGSAMDQLRAMQQSIAQQRGGDALAPQGGGDPQRGSPSGPIDANGFPSGGQTPPPVSGTGAHTGMSGAQPPAEPGYGMTGNTGPHPGMRGVQNPYGQQQGPQAAPQPQPGHHTGGHPAQGPPSGGYPAQGPPSGGYPAQGHPSGGYPAPGHHTGGHPAQGHPAGGHPAPGGHQYERENPPSRNTPPPGPDPRYGTNTGENPGFGGNTGPNPTFGASTEDDSPFGSHGGGRSGSAVGTGPQPEHRLQHGPYTDPTPSVGPHGAAGAVPAGTVDDAVHVARREGNDFAESIARDAPALWMEAVLVRRPRMPSDLEARLLQGSALPIDYLLRDEVREALRQGFWGALERAARG